MDPAAPTRRPGRALVVALTFLLASLLGPDVGAASPDVEAPEADANEPETYHIVVFGDSMADGVWTGVYRDLRGNDRVDVSRHTRVASGLSRPDFYDWPASVVAYLADNTVDIAVISLGLNDAQPIYHEGRWDHGFATETWDALYIERVAHFMTLFDEAGIPTFWVGLPTVRSGSFDARVAHINDIYSTQAGEHGVVYVPTRDVTAGEDGGYSAYLRDEDGRNRRVRANDGIHFTTPGYDLLASHILDVMRRELTVMQRASAQALDSD